MLENNIEIVGEKGEYKDFPYKKKLYLYGKCVFEDDFSEDISAKEFIEEFSKALLEAVCDYEEIYK